MTGNTLGTEDLQRFINDNQIEAEMVPLEVDTPTVEAAAEAVGTDPNRIAKSLLFKVGDSALLAIACGPAQIRRRALADHLDVGRRQVRLASPEEVLVITGYEVGTVPPFGHRNSVETLIDAAAMEQDRIYAGGGGKRTLVRVSPAEIVRVTDGRVLDLSGDDQSAQ